MIADLVEVVARPASRPASHECNTESPPRNAPSPRFVEKRWNMGRRTLCSSPSLSIPSEPVSHPDASSDEGYILSMGNIFDLVFATIFLQSLTCVVKIIILCILQLKLKLLS